MDSRRSPTDDSQGLRRLVLAGGVVPAHPLALTGARRLDEQRQVALTRYYLDAGATGLAVGVHTTQFAIRKPGVDLLEPVLSLAAHTARTWTTREVFLVAGVCGETRQACREAHLARELGYDVGLLALRAGEPRTTAELIDHARAVASQIPLMGFYLQEAVGGRVLTYDFWRRFLEIPEVVAIKVAPFDRYRTCDVIRAVHDAGRDDVALYTGNDDAIVADLTTPFLFSEEDRGMLRFVGGLLGQFAVWTQRAAEIVDAARAALDTDSVPTGLLRTGAALTDANAALFDAANRFAGCIPGIHEALVRHGLMAGRWCLDPGEVLSTGQLEEIDRIWAAYPSLRDDEFIAARLGAWLA